MLGRDHALSGALAFTAVTPLLHVTGAHRAAAVVLTAGAGVLPDIDEPGSTIAPDVRFPDWGLRLGRAQDQRRPPGGHA